MLEARDRRSVLIGLLALTLLGGSLIDGASGDPAAAVEPSVPNFVYILTDDQRWDTIGRCLGGFDGSDLAAGEDACMPRLQEHLVARGTTFLRGYVTTAVCCPSRATSLTGLYSRHHGVTRNSGYPNFDESSTIATWLSQAGYRTGFVGKYLNGYGKPGKGESTPPPPHVPPGWDHWHAFWDSSSYGKYSMAEKIPGQDLVVNAYDDKASTSGAACAPGNQYSEDVLCRRSLEFLDADGDDPFLLYLWNVSPHLPATAPTRWAGHHASVDNPRYPSYDEIPSPDPPKWVQKEPMDEQAHQQMTSQFRAQLDVNRAVDDTIHALTERLASDGRLGNTVFVFTSDNGLARGEHRHTKKACGYEECHRVPLVIACPPAVCPGASGGTVDDRHLALNIDIPATFADLAGVAPPFPTDGRSLAPVLRGTGTEWRRWFTLDDHEPYVGKIDGVYSEEPESTYKYIRTGKNIELYDLAADPWELANLANSADHAAVQDRLGERLDQALERGPGAALLDVDVEGAGEITSAPPGIGCGADCWEIFPFGTEVALSARPEPGSTFLGWGGACAGTGGCVVTMERDALVTARFGPGDDPSPSPSQSPSPSPSPSPAPAPLLTVSLQGNGEGRVASDPSGIDCPADCSERYPAGTEVLLRAGARRGSQFVGWGGACSGNHGCVVTMGSDVEVVATFELR